MAKPGFFTKRAVSGIPLGWEVRKRFATQYIFQVIRGNGAVGTIAGKKYQQRKAYYVPSSISNIEGQPARDLLTTAVSNWKNVLTQQQKDAYNERATRATHMSGYNLYVKEFIEAG